MKDKIIRTDLMSKGFLFETVGEAKIKLRVLTDIVCGRQLEC